MVKVPLGLVYQQTDLLQALQVPNSAAEEEAEYHIHRVGESQTAFLLIANEVYHHVGLEVAHRNQYIALHDDTQGDGSVGGAALHLLNVGDTQNYKYPSFINVITGTLVGIGDVGNIVIRDSQLLLQEVNIFLCWACNLNPAVGFPFVDGTQTIRSVPVCLHLSVLWLKRVHNSVPAKEFLLMLLGGYKFIFSA